MKYFLSWAKRPYDFQLEEEVNSNTYLALQQMVLHYPFQCTTYPVSFVTAWYQGRLENLVSEALSGRNVCT